MKKCPKCGSRIREGSAFCVSCGAKLSKGKYMSQKSKRKKKSLLKAIVITVLLAAIAIGIVFFIQRTNLFNVDKNVSTEFTQMNLAELNQNCIKTEQISISLQSETEGSALIKVYIPDYTELFQAAIRSKNPDQYIVEALDSGETTMIETEVSARVTVKNGEQIIHTEEAIKKLIEKELSKAITAVMEEQ